MHLAMASDDAPALGSLLAAPGDQGGSNIYLKDLFTDTNGTALDHHTMDIGPGWTILSGTPQIAGNKMAGTTNSDNVAVSDAGHADITLTVVYVHQNDTLPVVVFRRADANHFWIAFFQSGTWQLQEYVNGVYTTRGTGADSLTAGQGYNLQLTLSGASITLYRDGTQMVSYNLASTGLTATLHGPDLAANGSAPTGTFDTFLVTSP